MSNVSVSRSWVDDMQRERQEMLQKMEKQAEQLRQKDETIKALADALELLRKTAHNDAERATALPLVDAVLRKHGRIP